MKVLKFGGTSVGTIESLCNVKAIVEGQSEPVIVVVSALGGLTDRLIATAKTAAAGGDYYPEYHAMVVRHHDIIAALVPQQLQAETKQLAQALLDELGNIYRGVSLIGDLSDRSLDIIVSYGERLSSTIISRIISGAALKDSRQFIATQQRWGKHVLDTALTAQRISEAFAGGLQDKVTVVPGFIASDAATGAVTNLGRGGSDYTAAILAAELGASVLEIWTDVDGFMTADPRVISGALVIDRLTFAEAMELCNFGAKVIYPPTIYPVFHRGIPIYIKNTFNPTAPGTLICEHDPAEPRHTTKAIKGISSISDTSLVTVQGLGMVGVIGINSRIFRALAQSGISVFLVSQAASENNTSFAVRNADAARAIEVLRHEFAPELAAGQLTDITAEHNLATAAIVGENMKHTPGIAGRLFNALGRVGISVISCAQGASETNISFVIKMSDLRKALNVIHDSFFLSDAQVLNLFIVGVGNVGSKLLDQIHAQERTLLEGKSLRLRVVGIANSRHCVFNRDGIDTATWRQTLENATSKATPQNILDGVLGMNIFNSVFVDCTSSAEIAALYKELLNHNVNVVASNKIAASGPYENYESLKKTARRRGVKFLFETNVGAGLPIINTINSLINSGDTIECVEAVVSGTLNYLFNAIEQPMPLSQAVEQARRAGYTEPDPRVDLSGSDVARKIVILTRESGYRVEQSQVERESFIPEKYFEAATPTQFLQLLPQFDDEFAQLAAEAKAQGKRLRYVASMRHGQMRTGLCMVGPGHPFYNLEGSNNVILLTTARYNEYPMIIKGYGAGADVTAAGVFADIISIANIR